MAMIDPVDPEKTTGKAKELLDRVKSGFGMVPNVISTMANAPVVLEAYLDMGGSLGNGMLSPQLREQIALAVSEANSCEYCISAHSAFGIMVGIEKDEIISSRKGKSEDEKIAAALQFSKSVVAKRGLTDEVELKKLRDVGYTNEEIVEIIGNIALTMFTNYFNHIVGTDIDFPKVPTL
jgi:uncharacterized peroxidase-related enzyme